jgi:hypothetical protein
LICADPLLRLFFRGEFFRVEQSDEPTITLYNPGEKTFPGADFTGEEDLSRGKIYQVQSFVELDADQSFPDPHADDCGLIRKLVGFPTQPLGGTQHRD